MKEYVMQRVFKASTGIAQGIFITLGIGLLLENIGKMLDIQSLMLIGNVSKMLMAPGIGAGIAFMLGANGLVIFSAMIAAALGAGAISVSEVGMMIKPGEPIGALLTATLATFIGKRISGKTPLDMMAVPIVTIGVSGFVGLWLSGVMGPLLTTVGGFIKNAASGNPLATSIVIAIVWGLLLISPASSVALAIALNLDGLAGGAALAGCAAHFAGFAFISRKENDLGGILAQAICTPKVQLPNITKNPYILLPTVISSAIVGPIATLIFNIEAGKEIAGMGLSSFVAPINIIANNGDKFIIVAMLISYIILPVAISFIVYKFLRKKNLIKNGDLTLPQ
ncbi:PTS transporter subunit IIC [Peribacillus tepidiphilus]|uniref:PTS transporter subunit IIC n=1 Tax=Peribacillus tepidiphilus TaxID=2652445 RepID=UPI001292B065|nr:PTS sugar transporter subunit IIC [Peribacillus tepidiphilus]